jgi:hypothetical protein
MFFYKPNKFIEAEGLYNHSLNFKAQAELKLRPQPNSESK